MVEQGLAILLVIGSLVYAPFLALVRRQAAVIAAPGESVPHWQQRLLSRQFRLSSQAAPIR